MDKAWMKAPRSSREYASGLKFFLQNAISKAGKENRILCPCRKCENRFWLDLGAVEEHLICDGFKSGYTTWLFHGECVMTSEPTGQPSADVDSCEFTDDMGQLLVDGLHMYDRSAIDSDVQDGNDSSDDCEDEDIEAYLRLVNDGGQPLYPGCTRFTKLEGYTVTGIPS